MKESRTKNASRNIIMGIMQQTVSLIFPFIIRSVLIYNLGVEYLGLNSLFSSIIQVLSLTELGVSSAMVFNMYKPIAEKDDITVCALLKLYRKIYFYIGSAVIILSIILLPFLKYLINGTVPIDINIYILYAINIINLSFSYFLFGYMQSLFIADQRSDIISKINLAVNCCMYSFQIIILFFIRKYYIYIILLPIATIIQNILNNYMAKKKYPQFKCKGEVSHKLKKIIFKKTVALFGTKLSTVILNASDSLIISAFLGLKAVAIYGNYYYIFSAVVGIITIIFTSLNAGIGNSIITEKSEKNYFDFQKLTLINFWLIGVCGTCLLCLYQPFIRIWIGEDLMYQDSMVFLFIIYFFMYQSRRVVVTYKDSAGIWWEDRFRPYIMLLINLTSNIILIQIIGIYGVILSTIFSLIFSIPWENHLVFKLIFNLKETKYYCLVLFYTTLIVISMSTSFLLCSKLLLSGISELIIRLIICLIVPNTIFIICNYKRKEYISLRNNLKYIFNKK